MRWLWYVGPIVVAIVYLWSALWPSRRERWRLGELRRWVRDFLGPFDVAVEKPRGGGRAGAAKRDKAPAEPAPTSRFAGRLPQLFDALVEKAGLGDVVGNVVLVPKLAYLAVRKANRVSGSDHQTVVAKLAKPAPTFVARPMPVVEGRRQEGQGITFEDDPDFAEQFLVEGPDAKAILGWLDDATREALLELPGVWLRTDGRLMALTLYGDADADRLDELVGVADALFAERGAGGAPPLLGEGAEDDEGDEQADKQVDEPASYRAGSKDKLSKRLAKTKTKTEPELASVGARSAAFVIDAALYAVTGAILLFVLSMREQGLGGLFGIGAGPTDEFDGGWQGGWDTKGFGALVVAESLILGLFVLQTYWAAQRGQTIGMRLIGARAVRLGGEAVEFFRGVLLRTWLLGLVPLGLAFALTRPLQFRPLLAHLIDPRVLGALAGAIVLDGLVMLVGDGRRALHDYLTGTKVVVAPRDMFDALKRS